MSKELGQGGTGALAGAHVHLACLGFHNRRTENENNRRSHIYLDNHIFYVLLNKPSKGARAWDLSDSEVGQSELAGPPFDTVLDVADKLGIATNH